MKKVYAISLAALMFCATIVSTASAFEAEGGAYVGFYDKYLWRGFDLSGSVGVVQGGVDLSANGFTVSYWTNMQADDDKPEGFKSGEATETDIVLDYSFDAGEMLSVSLGNIYYTLDGLADTNEAYLGLTLNTVLGPSVTVYYDWDECKEDGVFVTAAIGHSFEIGKAALNLGAAAGFNQESDYAVFYEDADGNERHYSDWHNYELSASVDFPVTENVTISPSFLYSSPISRAAKLAIDSETVGGLTVAFAF